MINDQIKSPKISIITPSYNQGDYLEATIQSILSQGYPNLEYIIIDGGSTDNSTEIIQKYSQHLAYWVSEPDKGMYDAIQKGFEKSTGDIMAWLNSDDLYHRGSLFTIAEIFTQFPQIEWLQACSTAYNEDGLTIKCQESKRWSKYHYYLGEYRWIQQESCVWTRALWEKTGASLNTKLRLAGDLELWSRFFQVSPLYVADILIGGFRYRKSDQLSLEGFQKYVDEAEECLAKLVLQPGELARCKQIKWRRGMLSMLKFLNKPYLERRWLKPLYELPPMVRFNRELHSFELTAL